MTRAACFEKNAFFEKKLRHWEKQVKINFQHLFIKGQEVFYLLWYTVCFHLQYFADVSGHLWRVERADFVAWPSHWFLLPCSVSASHTFSKITLHNG